MLFSQISCRRGLSLPPRERLVQPFQYRRCRLRRRRLGCIDDDDETFPARCERVLFAQHLLLPRSVSRLAISPLSCASRFERSPSCISACSRRERDSFSLPYAFHAPAAATAIRQRSVSRTSRLPKRRTGSL